MTAPHEPIEQRIARLRADYEACGQDAGNTDARMKALDALAEARADAAALMARGAA